MMSNQVYVNGVFSGGFTNTAKFSLYVSPYLVANQGGRYTKHIYAGSQRIVSKVGDFASYGSDPRRIEYAGANTDGLSVNYKAKYAAQQQVIKDNYKTFDVPYNGTDNDNYADGEGFCCNDGYMEAAMARARKAQARAVAKSFKDPDNYENLQFFYHPDHLGSSSFITNLEGEVVQHIEYVPFGEVFIEERNNITWGIEVSVDYYKRRVYGNGYFHFPKRDEEQIDNAKMLVQYLNKYDKNWRSTNGGHPIIILHACATSDFAKEMSNDEEFKDVTFIAPNATLFSSKYGNEKVNDIATGKDYKTIVSAKWEVYRNGEFVKDKNGKPITYQNTDQSGTVGFDYKF